MKIRIILIAFISSLFVNYAFGQKHITKTGRIDIFSQTPAFTIEGVNKKVASILDTETGAVAVSTLVRSFDFEEALVEEHFNENYIESHKYPKSTFKGTIVNNDAIDYTKNGSYSFTIKGELNIHGTTNTINETGTITVKDGIITAQIKFIVSLEAYKVKVEKMYKNAIKDEIELDCKFEFDTLKK